MSEAERQQMARMVREAQLTLTDRINPRDDTERAIVNALGDISWDEAVEAINRHRSAQTVKGDA